MARTLPDRCPAKHLGFTDVGLCHQRHVRQQLVLQPHLVALGAGLMAPMGSSVQLTGKPLSCGAHGSPAVLGRVPGSGR